MVVSCCDPRLTAGRQPNTGRVVFEASVAGTGGTFYVPRVAVRRLPNTEWVVFGASAAVTGGTQYVPGVAAKRR